MNFENYSNRIISIVDAHNKHVSEVNANIEEAKRNQAEAQKAMDAAVDNNDMAAYNKSFAIANFAKCFLSRVDAAQDYSQEDKDAVHDILSAVEKDHRKEERKLYSDLLGKLSAAADIFEQISDMNEAYNEMAKTVFSITGESQNIGKFKTVHLAITDALGENSEAIKAVKDELKD